MSTPALWDRFRRHLWVGESIGMRLDISRMKFEESYFDSMAAPIERALRAMAAIEKGERANRSENRMVGHYWLRTPELAPDESIRTQIENTVRQMREFASKIHDGRIRPQRGDGFFVVLVIGIGGSALGPQLVADALGGPEDVMAVLFLDNTDPDGIDRVIAELDESLEQTLTVVISKSGGTAETRNAMIEVAAAYKHAGLSFAKHAVAVTGEGSELHRKALAEKWLATFPMWDWVGGRTSVTSAVGLLPAALQGLDVEAFLAGARECDAITRQVDPQSNPAALLALMWHHAGNGHGEKNMVVLPYRDRLALLGRYLQQLVMESIGKATDRAGLVVEQGLTVFGNKGSTDQHSFVQQLREGRNDFFVTFVNVLRDRAERSAQVEPDVTAGDYLLSFLYGTRAALAENGRESCTITLNELNAQRLGALVALLERAVGLYAELIDVNAYDQPGVEAGKKAAAGMLELQRRLLAFLREHRETSRTAEQIAAGVHSSDEVESVWQILEHLAANPDHGIRRIQPGAPTEAQYQAM